MNITVQYHDRQIGPYTVEEVNRRLRDGKFKPDALAWVEGTEGWVPLKTIPGVDAQPKAEGSPEKVAPVAKFDLSEWLRCFWKDLLAKRFSRKHWIALAVIVVVLLAINQMQQEQYEQRKRHDDEMRDLDNMRRDSYARPTKR
jgi:hypothetical protein